MSDFYDAAEYSRGHADIVRMHRTMEHDDSEGIGAADIFLAFFVVALISAWWII